jgi:lipopolysaccharide heptosyltransferase II
MIERIAIFRALHLGDLLLAVPAFRALRAAYPQAEISLIGLPWARWFVERFDGYIDRLIEFNGFPGITEVDYDPERANAAIAELRAHPFDLLIQLHGSGETSNRFIAAIAGPETRTAGHFTGERPAFLTVAAPYPSERPEIERNLNLMRLFDCPDTGSALELPLLPSDGADADRLLGPVALRRPLIGLHPGANYLSRRWPAERFAVVADRLAEAHDATIVLTGGSGEERLAAEVAARMHAPALDLAGRTSLGGLAALIARFDLFISNDTGPAHVANALDVPSITIFGPAEFTRWAPLDCERHIVVRHPVACSPCPHRICPIDHRCLRRITPDQVIAAAERQLVTANCEPTFSVILSRSEGSPLRAPTACSPGQVKRDPSLRLRMTEGAALDDGRAG